MYKLGHMSSAAADEDGDGDDPDDDEPQPGAGPDATAAATAAAADAPTDGPDPDSEHVPPAGSAECKEAVSLMKQFLDACLTPGKYISIPNPIDDDDDPILFMNVLAVNLKCITASECSPIGGPSTSTSASADLTVTFQPLERSLQIGTCAADLKGPFDIFIFSDEVPSQLEFGAYAAADRSKFLQWEAWPPMIEGYVARLQNPQILRPSSDIDLMSPNCPALCILDYLAEQGWVGQRRVQIHSAAGAADKVYDSRLPVTKTRYLQCVISLPVLFGAGINALPSGRPATFYAYVLRFKRLPLPGKSMKDLRKEISESGEGDTVGPLIPILRPGAFVQPIDDEIAIDEPLPLPPTIADVAADLPPPPPDDPDPDSDPPPRSPLPSDDHSVEQPCDLVDVLMPGSDSDDVAMTASDIALSEPEGPEADIADRGVPVAHEEVWPDRFEGLPLIQQAGSSGGIAAHAPRLGVKCLCCDHYKSRSVALLVPRFGRNAPLYFLGAWLHRMGSPNHRGYVPSIEDIAEYAAANPIP